jgi:hypothetical protein
MFNVDFFIQKFGVRITDLLPLTYVQEYQALHSIDGGINFSLTFLHALCYKPQHNCFITRFWCRAVAGTGKREEGVNPSLSRNCKQAMTVARCHWNFREGATSKMTLKPGNLPLRLCFGTSVERGAEA